MAWSWGSTNDRNETTIGSDENIREGSVSTTTSKTTVNKKPTFENYKPGLNSTPQRAESPMKQLLRPTSPTFFSNDDTFLEKLLSKENELIKKEKEIEYLKETHRDLLNKVESLTEDLRNKTDEFENVTEELNIEKENRETLICAKIKELKTVNEKELEYLKRNLNKIKTLHIEICDFVKFDLKGFKSNIEKISIQKSKQDEINKTKMTVKTKSFDEMILKEKTRIEEILRQIQSKQQKTELMYEDEIQEYKLKEHKIENILSNIKLFGVDISLIIHEIFDDEQESGSTGCNFEYYFMNNYPNIVDFKRKEEDNHIQALQDSVKIMNTNFASNISNLVDKLSSNNHDLEDKFSQLFNGGKDIEKSEYLRKENKELLTAKEALVKELESLKEVSYTSDENKFSQLIHKLEVLADAERILKEKLSIEQTENQALKQKAQSIEEISFSLKTKVDIQEKNFKLLTQKLKDITGDTKKKITFKQICKQNVAVTLESYQNLKIDEIDTLTIVELQNVIKNFVLLLDIPFDKLAKKVPLIAIYLTYERNLFQYFVDRLYCQIFGKQMEFKSFTREAYNQFLDTKNLNSIQHPLTLTLEELCNNIIAKL